MKSLINYKLSAIGYSGYFVGEYCVGFFERQFFYCHSVILLPVGNSTATAVETDLDFYCHCSRSLFQFQEPLQEKPF